MNLYEINKEILKCIDEETGEVLDVEYLNNLTMAKNEKIENIALFIKNLLSNAEQIRAEMESLNKRMKSEITKAKSLKNYLDSCLEGRSFETAKCKISYRKSNSVEIDDKFIEWAKENADEYLNYKEPEVNKTAVKKAINNGVKFDFTKLTEHNNIQIK